MTDDDKLAALERLANEATPGPWSNGPHSPHDKSSPIHIVSGPKAWLGRQAGEFHRKDATFIAAARTAMPELIAEVRRLRGLRCNCDEEEGRHAPDCVTQLPAVVDGMGEEIDRLRAEVADLRFSLAGTEGARKANAGALADAQVMIKELEDRLDKSTQEVVRRGELMRDLEVLLEECAANLRMAEPYQDEELPKRIDAAIAGGKE